MKKKKLLYVLPVALLAIIFVVFLLNKANRIDINAMPIDAPADAPVQEESLVLTNNNENFLINGSKNPSPIELEPNTLLKVTVTNNSAFPTSLHFHGINGASKMDGVGGVTQDNIQPGTDFTYQFYITKPGTYMYHAHVDSAEQVNNEFLFGPVIVNDADRESYKNKEVMTINSKIEDMESHGADASNITSSYINGETSTQATFLPNNDIYLSIINMSSSLMKLYFGDDIQYQVIEVDSNPVDSEIQVNNSLEISTAQRVDVIIKAPSSNFTIQTLNANDTNAVLRFNTPDNNTQVTNKKISDKSVYLYDIISMKEDLGLSELEPDKDYQMHLDMNMNGWTVNGSTFPNTKDVEVTEGDIVDITLTNTGHMSQDHPFHLHGHQFQVIEHNGKPLANNQKLVLDTLNVQNGETYKIRFKANNPGIWMFHCHNLDHAAKGMMTKVVYDGYYSSVTDQVKE